MMTTLSERYVAEVVRAVPEAQRADLEQELAASIADAVEARIESGGAAGEAPEEAEYAVLVELGDPSRLAADYSGRPSWLIGPRYFHEWWRLLKLLLIIVIPCAVGGIAIAQAIAGEGIGGIIGSAIGIGFSVAVHLVFWVTLVFAIAERGGASKGKSDVIGEVGTSLADGFAKAAWTPDRLPERLPPSRSTRRAESVTGIVFLGLLAAAIVVQHFWFPVKDAAGESIPLLDPALWSFWIPVFFALIAAELVFLLVLLRAGRWTWSLAFVNAAIAVLWLGSVSWLIGHAQLINPVLIAELGWEAAFVPVTFGTVIPVLAVNVIGGWDIVDGFLKAYRDARAERVATVTGVPVP